MTLVRRQSALGVLVTSGRAVDRHFDVTPRLAVVCRFDDAVLRPRAGRSGEA